MKTCPIPPSILLIAFAVLWFTAVPGASALPASPDEGQTPVLRGAGPASTESPALSAITYVNHLRLSWPAAFTDFQLRECQSLQGSWSAVSIAPVTNGTSLEVVLSLTNSTRFFRLQSTNDGGVIFPPAVLGLALDPEGRPVPNAQAGTNALTDGGGIASGDIEVTAAGWTPVSAPGYATAYAQPGNPIGNAKLFEVWLTPWQAENLVRAGQTNVLLVGPSAAPSLKATIEAAAFARLPVRVSITEINPLDVGPLFAPLDAAPDFHLSQAFALQAHDTNDASVLLQNGAHVVVELYDGQGLTNAPLLARFDPRSGHWLAITNGCQRARPDYLECSLDSTAPLFGLFVPEKPAYLSGPTPAAKSLDRSKRAGATPAADAPNLSDAYKRAQARLANRLKEIERANQQGDNIDPATDPEAQSALADLAGAATDFATANPGEGGKLHLAKAAEAAMRLGDQGLVDSLLSDAAEIANQLARDLLNANECGRIREMLHAAEQVILFGGDQSLVDALEEKIRTLLKECDLWVGTIRYAFPVDSVHPGLDNYHLTSGGGVWTEMHDLRMATDAKTLVLSGEDIVHINFPQVRYEATETKCEQSIAFYGQPAGATVVLNFSGTYNGFTFSLGDIQPASDPISITQRQMVKVDDGDGNCVTVPPYPIVLPFPNYYSVLMHGFLNSPPVTIQEMVEGIHNGSGEGETITGFEQLSNPFPDPNYGRYPFTTGTVFWRFIRVKAIIPLESSTLKRLGK